MKKINLIYISALTIILVVSLLMAYDYIRPKPLDAQCISVFGNVQTQSCNTPWCDTGCGGKSCSVAVRPNQFCFISRFEVGDMGGGSDRVRCIITGTTATVSTSSDGRGSCGMTCVNFL